MPRPAQTAAVLAALALSAGCSLLEQGGRDVPAPAGGGAVLAPEMQLVADYLATLERLAKAGPAEQAEIAQFARRAFELDPTTANHLRHALVLSLPGHAASDPAAARAELGTLLATPERMLPTEQALAFVMYQDVNARLALQAENQRLATADNGREDRERLQAANRRLQAQATENARLKAELDEARAKLEAVATLERSLAERQATPPRNP
jgi:hypothetical protein